MEKRICLLLLCCCCLGSVWAQDNKKKSYPFHSLNSLGLVNGSNGVAAAVQSVNGFTKGSWFAGIGIGLDYYRFRTIPLFAEVKRYFGTSKSQFFLYADGGTNFVWEKEDKTVNYPKEFHSGFYSNTGFGYKAGFKNGMAFLLSAGYSHKKVIAKQGQIVCPFIGPCYMQYDTYNYGLNRLIIQTGWLF